MSTGKLVGLWALGVAVVLGLAAGIWGLQVLTSGPVGQGDAIIKKNSAQNWTAAQARFEDMYAGIQAQDQTIVIAHEKLERDPDDRNAETEYDGARQVCAKLVGDYNAEARKFLSQDFRSADLPEQISSFDTTTDCKE